jgi:superfamily I DNA and/or RNA helicase
MEDIKKVLSSYKQRFISPRSQARTYFLTRLNNKHTIDLEFFNEIFGKNNIYNELISNGELHFEKKKINIVGTKKLLFDGNKEDIKEVKQTFPSFTKKDFDNLSKLRNKYKRLLSIVENYDNQDGIEGYSKLGDFTEDGKLLPKSKLEDISDNLCIALESQISDLIEKYLKQLNRDFQSIEKLTKTSDNYMRDFGKNDLYLGFPFIEGRFVSGKLFRAPLVMHRIIVKKKQNTVSLKIEDNESILNPVFLVSYHLESELEHKLLDWELKSTDFIDEAIRTLKGFGIKVDNTENKVEKFYSCTKSDYRNMSNFDFDEFKIKNNAVLGLFPISDKNIFNDLQELEELSFKEEDSITTFVKGNENIEDIFVKKEEKRVLENEIKYITELDYSQKNVVKEAMDKNLVIEGPPGTGKSQVLSNIVANYVDQGKKVLVVSEKVAAIEVIHNRLGRLSINALLLKNHITDKDFFYQQVDKAISSIIEEGQSDTYKSYDEIDRNSEEVFERLTSRSDFYNKKYEEFSLEEVIRYASNDSIRLYKLADLVNSYSLSKKEIMESIIDIVENENNKEIFNVLKSMFPLINENQNVDDDLIFEICGYLSRKTRDIEHNKILYYCFIKDIKLDNNIEFCKNRRGTKKSPKILLKDVSDIINTSTLSDYSKHLKELENPIYDVFKEDLSQIKNFYNWNSKSDKEKLLCIKHLKNMEFKFGVFSSKKPEKVLNHQELHLYNELNNNVNTLRMENVILNDLDVDLVRMLNFIVKEKSDNPKEIMLKMYMNGLYDLDLDEMKTSFESLNEDNLKLGDHDIKHISISDENIVRFFNYSLIDGIQNIEEIIESVGKHILQPIYNNLKNDLAFFESYQDSYYNTKSDLHTKMLKTRIVIENNLRRQIRLKGQRDINFGKAIADLKRISGLKRKKSIAVTTKRYTKELLELFPICLMTPGSVSATLKNTQNLFDVVIFDEASQLYVERAVPSIHRSKRIIVAGDSKQLRPSSFFSQRFTEDEIDENNSYDVTAALEEESLLDYCKNKYSTTDLRYHYRSDHKELIEFSNRAFYKNKLVFSSKLSNHDKKPIELIEVNGEWIDNKNISEAEKTVELVKYILKTRKSQETIGVITFNSKQRDLISDLMDDEALNNDDLMKELYRVEEGTGSDISLFVKNIENVQGDERDIIIFSVAYAKNQKGRFLNQFGPISQPTGENRLNVAITRAKKKIYLIKSFQASLMNVKESNKGAYYFKKYLQYVEKVSSESKDLEVFLNMLSDIEAPTEELSEFDSPFEIEVFDEVNKLLDDRYEIRNQIKVGSFSIDLAIYDKINDMFVLGIECDGAMYHSSKDAVEHDFYRQSYLESRGWVIHRIWSTNWWSSSNVEVSKVLEYLK